MQNAALFNNQITGSNQESSSNLSNHYLMAKINRLDSFIDHNRAINRKNSQKKVNETIEVVELTTRFKPKKG